jgi:hypothetical protein
MKREIAHIHSSNDHSVHVVLAPADCMFPGCARDLLDSYVLTFESR